MNFFRKPMTTQDSAKKFRTTFNIYTFLSVTSKENSSKERRLIQFSCTDVVSTLLSIHDHSSRLRTKTMDGNAFTLPHLPSPGASHLAGSGLVISALPPILLIDAITARLVRRDETSFPHPVSVLFLLLRTELWPSVCFSELWKERGSVSYLSLCQFCVTSFFRWFSVIVAQSNHVVMDVSHDDASMSWFRLQLRATCNIAKSPFNDWFTGHLNFQIEHQ